MTSKRPYSRPTLLVEGALVALTQAQACGTYFDGTYTAGLPTDGHALNGISGPNSYCLVKQ